MIDHIQYAITAVGCLKLSFIARDMGNISRIQFMNITLYDIVEDEIEDAPWTFDRRSINQSIDQSINQSIIDI